LARIITQEILVNQEQSSGMKSVRSKCHTVEVKCVVDPNAASSIS